jgi:hypothetical protein
MPFASIASIALGGVTGDVKFFLMNEDRRLLLKLPRAAVRPVVSKAKHLLRAQITSAEWEALKKTGERVWLFSPDENSAKDPHVKRYLALEENKGGCNRRAYKVSIRKPWYRTPLPTLPDAFVSGMSQYGPWLCINETRSVNATNTLYAVRFSSRNRQDWYKWALALLSSRARRQIRRVGRRYPDGLIKYEPGSMGRIALPKMRDLADYRKVYEEAVAALRLGRPQLSREIADSLVV